MIAGTKGLAQRLCVRQCADAGCTVLASNVWLGRLFDLDSSGRLFWQASAAFPVASALFFLLGGKRLFRQMEQS